MGDLAGMRVLLVDDHEDTLELLTELLRDVGADVRSAASAADALAALDGFSPHVLVTDIRLPDGDGVDLVRSVRSLSGFTSLPAVALTGDSRPADDCFHRRLMKPVEPLVLVATLRQAVGPVAP